MKQYALSFLFVLTLYTPSVAADYVWIGGAGTWNDPNHWSLTSGGPGGPVFLLVRIMFFTQ